MRMTIEMSWRDIRCPQCGEIFTNPIVTKKSIGIGFSFYPLGRLKCPKCGYEGLANEFKRPKPGEEPPKKKESEIKPEPADEQKKKLDESRFEKS